MPTLVDACNVIARIFDFSLSGNIFIPPYPTPPLLVFGVCVLLIKDIRDEFFPTKMQLMNNSSLVVRWTTYVMLIVSILLTGVFSSDQFIYANF
jgi:hypothetical protein